MQKHSKVLIAVISIIAIAMLTAVAVIAARMNGRSFSHNGGDYYNAFGWGHISDGEFYSLNYHNYTNTYFGANTKNDYRAYVAHSRDGYCLNEDVGTGSGLFYVANIIDIEGDQITFAKSGRSYRATTAAQKKALANMAYVLYARSNGVGSNTEWRNWMDNNGGWKFFYNTFAGDIDDSGLRGNLGGGNMPTKNSTYENILKNLVELKDNNSTEPRGESGNWNGYKTKMGPYSLQLNDNMTTTANVVSNGNHEGIVKKENGYYYVYTKDQITEKPTKITIKQTYSAYKARLILLGTGLDQARLIGRGQKVDKNLYLDLKTMPIFDIDVSLQKYIIKVNDKDITNNDTTLASRKNTFAIEGATNRFYNTHPSPNDKATNRYKKNEYVNIEAGDTVTYRIWVYNNDKIDATTFVIGDSFDSTASWVGAKDASGNDINWTKKTDNKYFYSIPGGLKAGQNTYFDVTLKFNTYTENILQNCAWIENQNGEKDNHFGTYTTPNPKGYWELNYRQSDYDYVKMRPYEVSLEKYITSVNGKAVDADNVNIKRDGRAEHKYDDDIKTNDNWKSNNVVVAGSGDEITYNIIVKNDSKQTAVKITEVTDTLPEGISQYKVGNGAYQNRPSDGKIKVTNTANTLLQPGQSTSFTVTVKPTDSNMSLKVYKNIAEITEMKNRNDVVVPDKTPNNNKDADYYELKDIEIAGNVWNDKALDKKAENYNGLYDAGKENRLAGITVYLYRGNDKVATTKTDSNGHYSFTKANLDSKLAANTRYIKAARNTNNNRWTDKYYSYYVVFEYDGITYTASPNGTSYVQVNTNTSKNNYKIDSNAAEDNKNGKYTMSRKGFNDQFARVVEGGAVNAETYTGGGAKKVAIDYTTKNEKGYIPQSNHVYNKSMNMTSSTNLIQLSYNANLEEQLKYVGLGLRGRDVFDLELKSDVYSTRVTVNGQTGEYNYDSNKVTVRKSDISVAEDMANFASEARTGSTGEVTQALRDTDVDVNIANKKAVTKYTKTGLGIEVTYRISVTNASQTDGTANQIIDYYDSRYNFKRAYSGDTTLKTYTAKSGNGYNGVRINTPATNLSESKTMDIYVVLELKTPETTLKALTNGTDRIPTFNMAEITEYSTKAGRGQTEYTRGILDKDSAPESVATEKVRLTTTESNQAQTTKGTPTTVDYYFSKISNPGTDLTKLKYEDDTYAAPTLYFGTAENARTLQGLVFRDKTTTDSSTRIKTGNGVYDNGEDIVAGATVELIENGKVRYRTSSKENGKYVFADILPGNYVVEYSYGNKKETVARGTFGNGINKHSYNGEDYQSTNNLGTYGAKKLNATKNVWYVFNEEEGVSTAKDNEARRKVVSDNAYAFTIDQTAILNKARDGQSLSDDEVKFLTDKTAMFATTPSFTLSVEKTVKDGNGGTKQNTAFGKYVVDNMNFGIAEVPVTTIDLKKEVKSFKVTDSAGTNVLASWENGKSQGNVLVGNNLYDVQIEDEKLQGARLEVTYDVKVDMTTEKDFTNKEVIVPTIDSITDFIDNDLSYNASLGQNNKYWEATTHSAVSAEIASTKYNGNNPRGTIDPNGTLYSTVVKAKAGNPILLKKTGSASCPITLEKTLSAEDVSIGDIITSSINTYEYDNKVEITKLNYTNTTTNKDNTIMNRDRVRTAGRYIIVPGAQSDSATSETITIHPPTGGNLGNAVYYIAAGAIAILAVGVVLVRKFAVKGKNE